MRALTMVLLVALIPLRSSSAIEVKQKGAKVAPTDMTAESLLQQADATFQTHDHQAALEQYTAAADRARKEFNPSIETEAISQVARMHLILGNKEEGRSWLMKATELTRESDPMGWSRYLGVRGRYEWKDNELEKARLTFSDMFDYCTANALWGRAVDAANMGSIVGGTPEQQVAWSTKGIKIAEANDVEKWLGPLWNNLAGVYHDMKQYDSALACYLKAREYHWRHSGEVAKLFAEYHVGMTHRRLGQYDEAGQWLRPVLAWAERLENHSAIGQACEDLGEIEIAQGRRAAGLELLKRARSEYKRAGFDTSWPELWENINARIARLGG